MLDVGGKPVSPFPQCFEAACVSTANHSQMCVRSFTSRIMAIPTHVVRVCVSVCWRPETGRFFSEPRFGNLYFGFFLCCDADKINSGLRKEV